MAVSKQHDTDLMSRESCFPYDKNKLITGGRPQHSLDLDWKESHNRVFRTNENVVKTTSMGATGDLIKL